MAIGISQAFRTQNLRLLGNLFDKNNFLGKKGYYLSSDEDGTRWIADPNETSGVFSGGILSATIGGTTFNVSAGVGQVVSRTVLASGEVETTTNRITWNAQNNVSLTYRTTQKFSYIYIDENGVLQQQSNTFTDSQYRNQIVLGVICHINLSTINLVTNKQNVVYGDSHRLYELMSTFGPIKRSGLSISAYNTGLRVSRSSGTVLLIGSNYITDQFEPDSPTINAAAPASICRVYRNGGGNFIFDTNNGSYYTDIDPAKYDNNSGTLQTVNNNQWTVQRLFFFPSNPNDIIIYYGFGVYNSLNDAFLAIENESFYEAQITVENAVFLGYILVRGGATNLSLITDARFIQAGISRNVIVGGGGAAGLVLDDLLDVQITSPSDSQFFVYENSSGLWKNATFNVVDPLVFTKSGTSLSLALNYASATQPGGVSIGTQTFAGSKTFKDNVIVSGNLTVNGTTVTINSSTLSVDDKNIELGSVVAIPSLSATVNIEAGDTNVIVSSTNGLIVGQALTKISGTGAFGANPVISSITSATQFTVSPVHATTGSIVFSVGGATDVTADGGGITLKGTTDKTFNWIDATDSWTSSENLDLATGKVYKINNVGVLSATTLGSSVVNSSLTSVGTLTNLTVTNTITGSVSGSAGSLSGTYTFWGQNFNGTQNVSGNLTSVGNITGSGGITITAGGSNQNVVLTPSGTGYTLLNGSVGIGTATPASLLHISSTGTAKLKITADTDNVDENDLGGIEISQDGGITTSYFGHDNTNSLILGVNSTTAPNIYIGTRTDGTNFVTSADAKVTILNGGNVGIGITSPITKLHVYSPVAGTGSERTTPVDVLTLESENTTAQEFTGFGQTIVFRGSTYNNNTQRTLGKILHQINDDSVSTTRGTSLDFQLLTDATGSTLASRMYIKYDGNVGIGTNSPTQKLEVAGYAMAGESSYRTSIYGNAGGAWIAFGDTSNTASLGRIGAYNALFNINSVNGDTSFQYNGSEKMRITTVGNVGIGTTNPNDKLTILAGNYLSFQTVDLTFNSGRAARIGATTTGSGIGELIFETYKGGSGGGEKMRINSDGNVSIGNASANNKLSVLGSVSIGSGYNTTAPTNGLIIEGNVGIGTTNPSAKFEVSGSSIISNPNPSANAAVLLVQDEGTATSVKDGTTLRVVNNGSAANYSVFEASSNVSNFVILNNGNVGIGISTPAYKTEIYSGAKTSAFTGLAISNFNNYDGTATSLVTSQLRFAILENPITTYDASQRTFAILESGNEVNNSSSDGFFAISTRKTAVLSEKFRITSSGNIGVGTTNPVTKLAILGGDDKDTGPIISLSGNSVNQFESGRIRFTEANIAASPFYQGAYVHYDGSNNVFNLGVHTNVDSLTSSDVNAISIVRSNAYVGIGTTNPSTRLEVIGTVKATLFDGPVNQVNITSDDATNSSHYLYFGATNSGASTVKASTKIRFNPSTGAFSSTTKSFRIPHLTKSGYDLVYGSLESPYHGIRLTGKGKTNGNRAEVILPDYINVLIDKETVHIQLTPIKCAKILYVDDIFIDDNKFTVKYDKSWFEKSKDVEFYWDFTAERKDVPKLIVEEKI